MLSIGLLFGLLGIGATFVLAGDGDDLQPDEEAPQPEEAEEVEIIPLDSFLPEAEEIDLLEKEAPVEPEENTKGAQALLRMEQPETDEDTDLPDLEATTMDDTATEQPVEIPISVHSGGPGDTLGGGVGDDRFEITLGPAQSDPTVIDCFNCEDPDAPVDMTTDEMLDTVWFRDEEGELLSQDALLEKDFVVEENDDINGITLRFADHQPVYLPNVTLAEFTENSQVIGNFGLPSDAT